METRRHIRLKAFAAEYLRSIGCWHIATEARTPIPRFRADVIGLGVGPDGAAFRAIVECKQSRADFLRDAGDRDALRRRRDALLARCAEAEATVLRAAEPHLIDADGWLFPDLAPARIKETRLRGLRGAMREAERLDRAARERVKLWSLRRWRQADVFLIAAPRGLLRQADMPEGWRLIEAWGTGGDSSSGGATAPHTPTVLTPQST